MLPSIVAEELKQSIRTFLANAFPVASPLFRRADGSTFVEELVQAPGEVFKGPYLSIALPFRSAEPGAPQPFEHISLSFTPYRHQQQAFLRLASPAPTSTLIATGTGSGKTECFLLPILDHCARTPGRGIKAIIVYPMNALATDQARRFAREVWKRPGLKGRVSVGLFVGDQERSPQTAMQAEEVIACKDTLREHPPDILLTNYKMLDFLLLRPKDQRLWRFNAPQMLRYLVVDELHTFDGAQGTDLACLIRRLRERLGAGAELACVGTSATIGGAQAKAALLEYAGRVFATEFEDEGVILEDRLSAEEFLAGSSQALFTWPAEGSSRALRPENYTSQADYLRAQARLWLGGEAPALDAPDEDSARQALRSLAERLREHEAVHVLLRQLDALTDVASLVDEWQARLRTSAEHARLLLMSLCALIAAARHPGGQNRGGQNRSVERSDAPDPPFLQVREQLWLRELRRMVASVGERPVLRFADDLQDSSRPLHLPVIHCRECHATGWGAMKRPEETRIQTDLQRFYQGYFGRHPEVCLLFPVGDGGKAGQGSEQLLCAECGELRPFREGAVCEGCGSQAVVRVWVPDMRRHVSSDEQQRVVSHSDCPFCGGRRGLSVMGYRAVTLTSVMIARLLASHYNNDPKLIAFSDSVQDAAHRAGFFGANTFRTMVRGALLQAVRSQEGMPLHDVAEEMGRHWQRRSGSDAAFVGTFIAPNMEWLRDYDGLKEQGRLPPKSDLPDLVRKRLTWETLAELGLRARIGRTLERSGAATVGLDPPRLDAVAAGLHGRLSEELGSLREVDPATVGRFLLGLLWRLRTQGAFYHDFLDTYIREGGKEYLLSRRLFMPGYGGASRPPALVALDAVGENFEGIATRRGGWYLDWLNKTLALEAPLGTSEYRQAYALTLQTLTRAGLLLELSSRGKPVWALDPRQWFCTTRVTELRCDACGHRLQVPQDQLDQWRDLACLRSGCLGCYRPASGGAQAPAYLDLAPRRLVPAEHTALLDADRRKAVEQSFIHGTQPWDVNLLSATPTLEMGIDIGDLSSLLLCSVPPAQANYLQRIGRAGRRDGNAVNVTVANGQNHDLYFYAEPLDMMTGEVQPPGVFLQATAVLERQLIAFGFDRWAQTGIGEDAIPGTLRPVLDAVQREDGSRFPYTFTAFVEGERGAIFRDFVAMYPDLAEEGREHLQRFLFGGEQAWGLAGRVAGRLHDLVERRKSLLSRVDALKRQLDTLAKQPADEATRERLDALQRERAGLQALVASLNKKPTLNFFTDEGLLPNYAFPEEGVTLQSVIYRRRDIRERDGADGEKRKGEYLDFEFQRPAHAALSELAPENRFYAIGRRVAIDQIDLRVSTVETWRLCDRCHYVENLDSSGDPHSVCPRCGSAQWPDSDQKRTLIRLKQVYANADDRESRIGDDSEQREPVFFNRQLLVDIDPSTATAAYRLQGDALPFGFEYFPKAGFREVNFGPRSDDGLAFTVAGDLAVRRGFRICRHCGKVQREHAQQGAQPRRRGFPHAFNCKLSRPNAQESEADFYSSLYLYRELTSEAIRILLPLGELDGAEVRLHSLIAALHLGLKQYFRGNVDHLQVTTYSEPEGGGNVRRLYLVVFDTVPGGTGYLKELLRQPGNLLAVLRRALERLQRCRCNEDEDKDGCYRCIYAYRESRHMDRISSRAAQDLIGRILAQADTLTETEGLAGIDINTLLESELERRFVDSLANAGGDVHVTTQVVRGKPGWFVTLGTEDGGIAAWELEPQKRMGAGEGVALYSEADFVLRPARGDSPLRPVAVYMDGLQHHYDTVAEDTAKRQALLDTGELLVWSLGWHDLPRPGKPVDGAAQQALAAHQDPALRKLFDQLAGQAGWPDYHATDRLIQSGPFAWLLHYLRAGERALAELRAAALSRTIAWLSQASFKDSGMRGLVALELEENAPRHVCERLLPDGETVVLGGLMDALGTSTAPIEVTVGVPRGALQSLPALTSQMAAHLCFDDGEPRLDKTYERAWRGFWGAANLLQFSPRFSMASQRGVRGGIYPVPMEPAAAGAAEKAEEAEEGALDPAWQEAMELSVFGPALRPWAAADIPVPEVGFELLQGERGLVAELELAWPDRRIGVLAEESPGQRTAAEALGWTVYVGLEALDLDRLGPGAEHAASDGEARQ